MAPKLKKLETQKSVKKAKGKGAAKSKLSPEELEARNRILEDFRAFDLNGDGQLQKGELKALLKVLDPENWNDESIDRLIIAFDKDGDGDISLEEFVDWVTGAHDDDDADKLEVGHSFSEALNKSHGDVSRANRKHAQGELEHLSGVDIEKEVKAISDSDLAPVIALATPSEPLLRLFALIWLILQPSTTKASGKAVSFTTPCWSAVQHLLEDASFINRIINIDARRKEMKVTHSMVSAYAVDEFFCVPDPSACRSPDAPERGSPLSYQSLLEACQSHKIRNKGAPLMALYKWCLSLLEANLRQLARDKLREQATVDFKEEKQKENIKEHDSAIAAVKNEASGLLGKLDDMLADL